MKKSLSMLVIGILLFSGAWLRAAEEQKAAEEYDEDTYGPLAPIIWEKPVKSVVFEHKNHTRGAGLECDSCHDELFPMEAGHRRRRRTSRWRRCTTAAIAVPAMTATPPSPRTNAVLSVISVFAVRRGYPVVPMPQRSMARRSKPSSNNNRYTEIPFRHKGP